jgi:hypothetical protein
MPSCVLILKILDYHDKVPAFRRLPIDTEMLDGHGWLIFIQFQLFTLGCIRFGLDFSLHHDYYRRTAPPLRN